MRAALCSVVAGFFTYCALSFLVGPTGLVAYKALMAQKISMEARLDELVAEHERLKGEIAALMSDPERAATEARSLGYLKKGEIAVSGVTTIWRSTGISIEEIRSYTDPPALEDTISKAIAIGFALALFAALLIPVPQKERARGAQRERLVQSASLE